jgi:hypothetical protein
MVMDHPDEVVETRLPIRPTFSVVDVEDADDDEEDDIDDVISERVKPDEDDD